MIEFKTSKEQTRATTRQSLQFRIGWQVGALLVFGILLWINRLDLAIALIAAFGK